MSAGPSKRAPSPTDADLLSAWAAGHPRAGAQLFDRYFKSVVRFFRNKTPNYDDLVQQTFLGAVEGRHRLEDPSKFRSYLFSVAYNLLRSEFRERDRRTAHEEFRESGMAGVEPHPIDLLVARAEQRLLLGALRRLTFDDQIVLELHFFEHAKAREIGEIMGLPEGTVRSRLRRAKERLEVGVRELTRDPALMHSTLTGLETWALGLRAQFES